MADPPTSSLAPDIGYELSVVDLDPLRAAICAVGELDLAAREELAEVLGRRDGERCRVVRVDLAQVTFLDCSCLGVLAASHDRLLDSDGLLVLTGVDEAIARVIRLAGLADTLFILPADQDPFGGVLLARRTKGSAVPGQRRPTPADQTEVETRDLARREVAAEDS